VEEEFEISFYSEGVWETKRLSREKAEALYRLLAGVLGAQSIFQDIVGLKDRQVGLLD
jgi:hypothetical protein